MVVLKEITQFLNQYLAIERFNDYCPNGLQVEVNPQVTHVVTAVTASLAAIEAAVECQADLLLVHHGFFWKGEALSLTGMKGKRIKTLMENGLNLMAYHLPLDAHPQIGNNAQFAQKMKWPDAKPSAKNELLWTTTLAEPVTACALSQSLSGVLAREPLHIPGGPIQFKRIAWCTGAAQSYLEEASALGVDAFISGEISENTTHTARELGIHYFAAGHHATERYGIQALGKILENEFDLTQEFIEISNPV